MTSNFLFGHLPFWLVVYTLALTGWACVGRFMMSAFVPETSSNYIWRGFRLLSDWAVWCAARLVPTYITARFLPLIAACWLFGLRMVVGLVLIAGGWAPRVAPPG